MKSKDEIIKKYKQLVIKKKSSKLTVKELCEEVHISRTTFYKHFKDTYEIADAEDFVRLTMPFICVDETGVFQQNVPEHIEICKECFDKLSYDLRGKYNFICVLNTGEKIIQRF